MAQSSVRSTVYIDTDLHQALRMKAACTHLSMSEIVNDAIRALLAEDAEDLAAFEERKHETPVTYEDFLALLKADGTI